MALEERRLVKSRRRFEYLHDIQKYPPGMVDVHHVLIPRRSGLKTTGLWVFLLALCSSSLYMLLSEDSSITILLYGIVVGVILLKLLQGTTVAKESVVIIPAFGVQLETHYRSGRVVRRFVPCDNILKAVLNECVTPVTCYWSLALILRDHDKLMLVFKELHPPLRILVPIWKALCTGNDGEDSVDKESDFG